MLIDLDEVLEIIERYADYIPMATRVALVRSIMALPDNGVRRCRDCYWAEPEDGELYCNRHDFGMACKDDYCSWFSKKNS